MSRAFQLNLALKTAILASGKLQKRIARAARIDETSLSHIVRGRRDATAHERKHLARVLGKSEDDLFPSVNPSQSSVA